MNRRFVAVVGIVVVLSVSIAVVRGVRAQSNAAPHAMSAPVPQAGDKKAEEQFKNIQVLKGVPADEVIPTMQFIAASLGVECDFCHVQGAFEKDDKKPKQTARKMMEMMFAINADNFDRQREVTCYTCHRGNARPVGMPPVMTADSREEAPEREKLEEIKEGTGPTADQLLDKYVKALGGAAAIDKVTSRVMKGEITFGEKSFPIDIYSKEPDERISFTHMTEGDSVTAFNGHEGWLGMPGRPLREMHGGDIDGASIDADLHLATDLKQMFSEAKVQGKQKIDDHETYVLAGRREGRTPIELYFDVQSGLLVRMVRYGETTLGRMPTQIEYADYRDVNGVNVPYRWTLARPGGRFTIQVSEVKENVPVDDAKFAKPASPAPQAQKGTRH
jgi:photosynthetic reaction center cytochrome c subunit